MYLHENRQLFEQALAEVNSTTGIDLAILEKDYFVTILLQKLCEHLPELIFKGGTSLSKCYGVIDRFSEDIDLTLDEQCLSQSNRQKVKRTIVSVCQTVGFEIVNGVEIKSKNRYNRYRIAYPALYPGQGLKPAIEIDTVFSVASFPTEWRQASCLIADFLQENGYCKLLEEYGLEPFSIRTQSLERTLIDKIFALCDGYLSGRSATESRHLYDIHMLYPRVDFGEEYRKLFAATRRARIDSPFCVSADDNVDIAACLNQIVREDYYGKDYREITEKLLYRRVSYEEAIRTLQAIAEDCALWVGKTDG